MKNACDSCKWQKKRLGGEWYCLKYGNPMRYGRIYCVAFERRIDEQVPQQKNDG